MGEQEGVIQYQLEYFPKPPRAITQFSRLNAWRTVLHRLRLVGQDPNRYDGYGFGNISQRIEPFDVPSQALEFVISGTQTGQWEQLGEQDYCIVLGSDPTHNRVLAEGPIEPSSEALTHAAVYAVNDHIRNVIHVHSPEIWSQARELLIPSIARHVAYGTPEMAAAVRQLFRSGVLKEQAIFSMRGHEDGIISFGRTVEEAGQVLIKYLALALAASDNKTMEGK